MTITIVIFYEQDWFDKESKTDKSRITHISKYLSLQNYDEWLLKSK